MSGRGPSAKRDFSAGPWSTIVARTMVLLLVFPAAEHLSTPIAISRVPPVRLLTARIMGFEAKIAKVPAIRTNVTVTYFRKSAFVPLFAQGRGKRGSDWPQAPTGEPAPRPQRCLVVADTLGNAKA